MVGVLKGVAPKQPNAYTDDPVQRSGLEVRGEEDRRKYAGEKGHECILPLLP